MKEVLDTSVMTIERTSDGFSRYVDHERKILTIGFTSEETLKRFRNFPTHEASMEAMRSRYKAHFG